MSLIPRTQDFLLNLWNQTPLHEWVFAGFFLALSLILPWIVGKIAELALRRGLRKLDRDLVESGVKAVQRPVSILVFTMFFMLALQQFGKMPAGVLRWAGHAETLLNGIAMLSLAFRAVEIAAVLFKRRMVSGDNTELDERWVKLVGVVGKGVVLFFGIVMIMRGLGKDILPLLTGAGFIGAALALAAQSTMGNIIGSFEIMMDRLFKEGDRISFGDYDGFVTKMGLRSIELTSLSGEKINLPNKDLVDKQIRNYTRKNVVFTKVSVGIAYDHSRQEIEKAMAILKKAALDHPKVKEAEVIFKGFGASTQDLDLHAWADYKDGIEYVHVLSELHLAVKERFDAEKIQFAFPTQTVYMNQVKS